MVNLNVFNSEARIVNTHARMGCVFLCACVWVCDSGCECLFSECLF